MVKTLKPLFRETTTDDYLNAINATTDWLDQQIVEAEPGIYWHAEGNNPSSKDSTVDMYAGASGTLLYYLELFKLTNDSKYLKTAEKAGDYIISYLNTINLSDYHPGIAGLEFPNAQWALNAGHTGIIFGLIEITKAGGHKKYADKALEVTETLLESATETENGVQWTGETGILADGGITVYLLEAAEYFGRDDFKTTALKAGHQILSTAILVDEDKIKFKPLNQKYLKEFANLKDDVVYEWPNFEYGTAGIGFILGKLYQHTNEQEFLDGAIKSANYIESIAVEVAKDALLVPYRLPDLSDVYYLSYCHGPVGTSRVFQVLYDITGEDKYTEITAKLARGIIATHAPHQHSDGYWHFYSLCCGTAGFIDLFLKVDNHLDNTEFLNYAIDSADKILSEAAVDNEGNASWVQTWSRVDPSDVSIDTGYFDGAAGIGVALLHLYAALTDQNVAIVLPDDTEFAPK